MTNKTQQRFDASIADAVRATRDAKDQRRAEYLAGRIATATRLLPKIEARIMSGHHASRDELAALKDLRSEYRSLLGFTVDRGCAEMPTPIVGTSGTGADNPGDR